MQDSLTSQHQECAINTACAACVTCCCCCWLLQAQRKLTGIMNFTNPGAISHNEVRLCVSMASGRGGGLMRVSADT